MLGLNPYIGLFIGVLGVSSSAILAKLTDAPPVIIASTECCLLSSCFYPCLKEKQGRFPAF